MGKKPASVQHCKNTRSLVRLGCQGQFGHNLRSWAARDRQENASSIHQFAFMFDFETRGTFLQQNVLIPTLPFTAPSMDLRGERTHLCCSPGQRWQEAAIPIQALQAA